MAMEPTTLRRVRAAAHRHSVMRYRGTAWLGDSVRPDRWFEDWRDGGPPTVRVFGSMARGDAGPQSDVDLLVEVGPNPSPWFPGGLVAELEELLGRRVQVVTERGLDDVLRKRVLEEAVLL